METPSSTTSRVTRSQTLSALSKSDTKTIPCSEMGFSKSKQRKQNQDRSALIDITNDSPIVGLASGTLETPISSIGKKRITHFNKTPGSGSGEALLRDQVKTLLQKVEEEAEISKFSFPNDNAGFRHNLKAFLNSPAGLLAPTPLNTPQVVNGSGSESEKDLISRSLFLDFSEKSDSSSECSSVVTDQGTGKPTSLEDDDASIWSIQVNASTRDEDEDQDEVIEDDDVYEDDADYGGEEGHDRLLLDELCEGMSRVSVNFMGKHTRFVYNSDDELTECSTPEDSREVVRLKGLPTPKGKHIRFQDEEQDA